MTNWTEDNASLRAHGSLTLWCTLEAAAARTVELRTGKDPDDGPLLNPVVSPVASFIEDGAYDRKNVYAEAAARHLKGAVVVPSRASTVPCAAAETGPIPRDRHQRFIAKRGRIGWQRASGVRLARSGGIRHCTIEAERR
ncbi:hypothetical protein [Belnapia sp. F-4-1]|uniref:hypothetical protein n=1 Tax=Belnapia sp. F-4-1 TaxID=1545443 RepID=UPI001186791E|nr:hypothetical protein [Belnapia sp. F-4-1]